MKNIRQICMRICGLGVIAILLSSAAYGQATLATDKYDYAPGDTTHLSGSGFLAGEALWVQVVHVDTTDDNNTSSAHQPWQVTADGSGNFETMWIVPADQDEIGASLVATADGKPSGLHAETYFTDNVAISAATGGTNISADLAQNGAAPAFSTLGNIVITEGSNSDFAVQTGKTLILSPPNGWKFNAGAGSAAAGKVGGGSGANEVQVNSITVSSSAITVDITVTGTGQQNNLTISGIQVQSTEGGDLPASGSILRTSGNPGTANIAGLGGTGGSATSLGNLSQALGALRLHVVLPGQSFSDASTISSSGISGTASDQLASVSFAIANLIAADREFNISTTYTGTKTITYSGPGGSPTYTTSVDFTNGQSTTTLATTLRKAETVSISATSATSPAIGTGSPSSTFTVNPGAVTKLQVLLPGETAAPGTNSGKSGAPTAQTTGTAISSGVRVNAVDADWNVVNSSTPDVIVTSSDDLAAIADDNGGSPGNMTLAAGTASLSGFTFFNSGTAQNIAATDAAATLTPNTSTAVTVNKHSSTTTDISSSNPSVFGQMVTFTSTVAGVVAKLPTGTVTFKDGGSALGTQTLDGSGHATFSTSGFSVATHSITVTYNGDTTYNASTSTTLSQAVNKANSSTVFTSSSNPACQGPVSFTATVSAVAPGSGIPTGTVQFKDGAANLGTAQTLNASGQATLTTSSLAAGTHSITALYNGSTSFNTSTSAGATQTINDCSPPTTASVTSPANGSNLRAATVPGTFSGTVADSAGGLGLNANSTTYTLRRASDGFYWNGSAWQVADTNLAATNSATTGGTSAGWTSAAPMPAWASQSDGIYSLQATATDKSGNSFTGVAASFTLDNTAPVTASVTSPVDATVFPTGTGPISISGHAADNPGGVGLNANTTTYTLQRLSDLLYWNGSTFGPLVSGSNRTTTHIVTANNTDVVWTSNTGLPIWASQVSGDYRVQATAPDKAGNSLSDGTVTFTVLGSIAPTNIGTQASNTPSSSLAQTGVND